MSDELKNKVDKDGKTISPVLQKNIMNYLIDIDGTITEDVPNEEPERMLTCKPFPDALEILNKWYEEGHIITFLLQELKSIVLTLRNGWKFMAFIIMVF